MSAINPVPCNELRRNSYASSASFYCYSLRDSFHGIDLSHLSTAILPEDSCDSAGQLSYHGTRRTALACYEISSGQPPGLFVPAECFACPEFPLLRELGLQSDCSGFLSYKRRPRFVFSEEVFALLVPCSPSRAGAILRPVTRVITFAPRSIALPCFTTGKTFYESPTSEPSSI